jgi:hypothetical protein
MPAGSVDPARIGPQHPDCLPAAERAPARFGDLDDHPLTGQSEPDEDHPPVEASHTMPAVRYRADVDLDLKSRGKIIGRRAVGGSGQSSPDPPRP